jgi:hypothetical protein
MSPETPQIQKLTKADESWIGSGAHPVVGAKRDNAMEYDRDILLNEYIQSAVVQGESILSGDCKTGNKAGRKLIKIYKLMEQNPQLSACILDTSFWHHNMNVRSWAAAHALGLKVKTSEAIAIMKNISSKEDAGIVGFNAGMALEVYMKRGYLKFYQVK